MAMNRKTAVLFGIILVIAGVFSLIYVKNKGDRPSNIARFSDAKYGFSFEYPNVGWSVSENYIKKDVLIYLQNNVSEQEISNLETYLKEQFSGATIVRVSKEMELAKFKERHKSDYLTLQALDELQENPLNDMIEVTLAKPFYAHDYTYDIGKITTSEKFTSQFNQTVEKINYREGANLIWEVKHISKEGVTQPSFQVGVTITDTKPVVDSSSKYPNDTENINDITWSVVDAEEDQSGISGHSYSGYGNKSLSSNSEVYPIISITSVQLPEDLDAYRGEDTKAVMKQIQRSFVINNY